MLNPLYSIHAFWFNLWRAFLISILLAFIYLFSLFIMLSFLFVYVHIAKNVRMHGQKRRRRPKTFTELKWQWIKWMNERPLGHILTKTPIQSANKLESFKKDKNLICCRIWTITKTHYSCRDELKKVDQSCCINYGTECAQFNFNTQCAIPYTILLGRTLLNWAFTYIQTHTHFCTYLSETILRGNWILNHWTETSKRF